MPRLHARALRHRVRKVVQDCLEYCSPYAIEFGADRIAAAYWNEHDPGATKPLASESNIAYRSSVQRHGWRSINPLQKKNPCGVGRSPIEPMR